MPKVIAGLEDRILEAAENRLLSGDLSSFSIRGVAADCGIAVGTVYNYYPDKESLMGAVMAGNWMDTLKDAETAMQNAGSFEDGVCCICAAIRSFSARYESVWDVYPAGSGFSIMFRKRHELLLTQIRRELEGLCSRFSMPYTQGQKTLTAELIIAAAQHPEVAPEEMLGMLPQGTRGHIPRRGSSETCGEESAPTAENGRKEIR